jgi:hypothetical protein
MLRLRLLFFVALPFLAVHSLMADNNFVVGTCKPRLPSFGTISAAVTGVPPGSTIFVCPGTYMEQVMITQPLTLQGITSANQDQALIAIPSTGAVSNVTSVFLESVAAQVLVQTAGPVDISNIAVDGTGGDLGCADNTWLAGIFYASGSSGEVSHVKVSGQVNGRCGVGVWMENDGNTNPFVSVENSSIHDTDATGILAGAVSAPSPNVSIRNNVVSPNIGLTGIFLANAPYAIASSNDSATPCVASLTWGRVRRSQAIPLA